MAFYLCWQTDKMVNCPQHIILSTIGVLKISHCVMHYFKKTQSIRNRTVYIHLEFRPCVCWKLYNSPLLYFILLLFLHLTLRKNDSIPFSQAKWASNAMVWIVLPRPISSAKIPLSRFEYMVTSQSRPMCWYSRRVCLRRTGIGVTTWKANQITYKSIKNILYAIISKPQSSDRVLIRAHKI